MRDVNSSAAGPFSRDRYVRDFAEVDRAQLAVVGGKGAHLGELSRIDGVQVPDGYCVTADAFRRGVAEVPLFGERLDRLARLDPDDRNAIRARSTEIRGSVERLAIADELASAITRPLARFDEEAAFAVRSSATAEDSAAASFAGQHDTYLNVGAMAVVEHVIRCWASLFSERAVTYRLRNGLDPRGAGMAVVVQQMLSPEASGVLFTVDPVTSNRKVVTVEAGFGLSETLVSGSVNADVHQVGDGHVDTTIATKQFAVRAAPDGGTRRQDVEPELQEQQALTEKQVVRLAQLGRRVEKHFGHPQDIEWCLVDGAFRIVQSRPITTLFPIPTAADHDNRVYVSVGHQQMMTDAMKPLGLSVWLLTTPAPMVEAGGRLFVDVTRRLASPASRDDLVDALGTSDPLIGDALRTVLDRGFVPSLPDEDPAGSPVGDAPEPIDTDPSIPAELIERSRESLARSQREIGTRTGSDLCDFILGDLQELKRLLFDPRSRQVLDASMEASAWLNEHLHAWLGVNNPADTLTQSAPNNVTAEMGLALLDVADAIRPHSNVIAFLADVEDEDFLDRLPGIEGGRQARDAIRGYLDEYGMRCVGEIDITRPRWSERPTSLVPAILRNIENFESGAARRRFEQGRREARAKEQELLDRLRALPDGQRKAEQTERMIDRLRAFVGYREYPKYHIVSRYFTYKQALLNEAERQVRAGVLPEREDVYYLTLQEFHDVVRTGQVDVELIHRRRATLPEHSSFEAVVL